MKFEVYCDESRPDLLCSQHSTAQYMVIGGLWLPSKNRDQMKADIHALRNKYRMGGAVSYTHLTLPTTVVV